MTTLTTEQKQQLDEQGYVIFPGVLSPPEVEQVLARLEALWAVEGDGAGQENYIEPGVRRLANLANKGDIFRTIFAHPLVVAAVEHVMGPDLRLSMLNAREVPPQVGSALQPFHSDTDNSGVPDESGFYSCTAVWMLDPFTADNGATRIIPGTHHSHKVPRDVLKDTYAFHPDETCMVGQSGDVGVFNGHCWHAGGLNRTKKPRRAILAHYLRADTPRPGDRRQHLSPEVRAQMTPRELEILGLDEKQYGVRMRMAVSNMFKNLRTKLPV
ncbi:MAG: phytanoyl-CoA dioxygenase family protein [Anaerolineaceae bacterium]|nr:phytanoyl-CoA dioxygenase family protein [Anaerolineaceae bacterium]